MKNRTGFEAFSIAILLMLSAGTTRAQDLDRYDVKPYYSETPLHLDGRLIETAWEKAAIIDEFPAYVGSASPALRTQARLVRDDKNLYIALICYDPVAEFIRVEAKGHDEKVWEDESVYIYLSPTCSNDSVIRFCVNANGARSETLFPERDLEWDCWWEAKANKRKGFWMAEVKIPYAGLWTGGKASDVWGLGLMRYVKRTDTLWGWTAIDKDTRQPAFLGKMKDMDVDLSRFAVTGRVKEMSPAIMGENPLVLTIHNQTESKKRLRIKVEIIDADDKVAYEYQDVKVGPGTTSDETVYYTLHKEGSYIINVFIEDLKTRQNVFASMDIPVILGSISKEKESKKGF